MPRASAFCSSVDSPGLLGQLMLATVAIHAARNSRNGVTTVFGTAVLVWTCLVGGLLFIGFGCSSFGTFTGALGVGAGCCVISSAGVERTGKRLSLILLMKAQLLRRKVAKRSRDWIRSI